ncbi:MAG TPA: DUF4440 domain-containing protein [Solibacterales bacterium]|nr:DUF4440 domain-containing protein [Bryobacterales bacterium]
MRYAGSPMPVYDLKQLAPTFAAAANAADVETLVGLYTEDAVFVIPGGVTVQGTEAIRAVLGQLLGGGRKMAFEHVYIFDNGDTALVRGVWTLTAPGPDGADTVTTGSSVEVLKKQPDGSWKYFIDHPWGGDAL